MTEPDVNIQLLAIFVKRFRAYCGQLSRVFHMVVHRKLSDHMFPLWTPKNAKIRSNSAGSRSVLDQNKDRLGPKTVEQANLLRTRGARGRRFRETLRKSVKTQSGRGWELVAGQPGFRPCGWICANRYLERKALVKNPCRERVKRPSSRTGKIKQPTTSEEPSSW